MYSAGLWLARCLGRVQRAREHIRRQCEFVGKPRKVHQEVSAAVSVTVRCRQADCRFLRGLGGKKYVRKEIYGSRTEHVCYRSRWANFRDFREGQAGGT